MGRYKGRAFPGFRYPKDVLKGPGCHQGHPGTFIPELLGYTPLSWWWPSGPLRGSETPTAWICQVLFLFSLLAWKIIIKLKNEGHPFPLVCVKVHVHRWTDSPWYSEQVADVCPEEPWFEGSAEPRLHASGGPMGRGTRGSWSGRGGSDAWAGRHKVPSEGERLGGKNRSWKSLRKFYTVGYDVMLSFSLFKAFSKNGNNHRWFALEFNVSVWPKGEKRTNTGATKGA